MFSMKSAVAILAVAFVACFEVLAQESSVRGNSPDTASTITGLHDIAVGDVDVLIINLAGTAPTTWMVRYFQSGQQVDMPEAVGNAIQRDSATFDPASQTIIIHGHFGGGPVVEDIRTLALDDRIVFVRDIYLDMIEENFEGRGLPILLGDDQQRFGLKPGTLASAERTAVVPAPRITAIYGYTNSSSGIRDGRVDMSCGKAWNGHRVVNDQANSYFWRITGSNFGSSGTVRLAGRDARVERWTATELLVYPTIGYTAAPMSTTLVVSTPNGSTSYGVGIVPAVRTRIFQQCTWHVAVTRLNLGKSPSPSAYGGYSSITASYRPTVGDQLQWNGKHTAIITAVGARSVSGTTQTWPVTVTEYNFDCKNSFRQYSTTFQIRGSSLTRAMPHPSMGTPSGFYR